MNKIWRLSARGFFGVCCLALVIFPLVAFAQDTTVPETGFGQICSRELGLATCVQRIYIFALGFGSLIALLMLILSGYRYMTAQGNAQQLENAKDAFASAFIGLIILFIAFVLLYLINPDLTRFKNFQETLTLPEISKFHTEPPDGSLTKGGGKAPSVSAFVTDVTMRENDVRVLQAVGSDPEDDDLTYEWTFESDPTGGKAQFYREEIPERRLSRQLTYGPPELIPLGNTFKVTPTGNRKGNSTVFFGIQAASPKESSQSIFDGQKIVVKVDVSDGLNKSELRFTITINGNNRPPTHKFREGTGQRGTPNSRLTEGAFTGPEIEKLDDPDGAAVETQWFFGDKVGGEYLGLVVCTGCNGSSPTFTIPDMTAPIDQKFYMASRDGLHLVKTEFTAFLAP